MREIAKLAGVSVATVSRVISGKDDGVSAATRERVLRIAKEHNYRPYASATAGTRAQSFLLGVIAGPDCRDLIGSVVASANEAGYGTIIQLAASADDEARSIERLLAHQVDGLIWARDGSSESIDVSLEVPTRTIDYSQPASASNPIFDFEELGAELTRALTAIGHRQLLLLSDLAGARGQAFRRGFASAAAAAGILVPDDSILDPRISAQRLRESLFGSTAVVCSGIALAQRAYDESVRQSKHRASMPAIVALGEKSAGGAEIAAIALPSALLGSFACSSLIAEIEKNAAADARFDTPIEWIGTGTLHAPPVGSPCRAIVVGAINHDVFLLVGDPPRDSETVLAKKRVLYPGGKGVNQAIAVSLLGGSARLIGKTGADFAGLDIEGFLRDKGVDTAGVTSSPSEQTGAAYIYVPSDGETRIVIHEGANGELTGADVAAHGDLFVGCDVCLVQTEVPMDAVREAVRLAANAGATVILKPAAVSDIPDDVLRGVGILVPNEREASALCPGVDGVVEQARSLRDRGAKTVILTRAGKPSYVLTDDGEEWFPAASFNALDTTGAADAFIGSLAVSISAGRDLRTAIRIATVAAGYSVTKLGAVPSFLDAATLELLVASKGVDHS